MISDKNNNDPLEPIYSGSGEIPKQPDWRESRPEEIEHALSNVWDKIDAAERTDLNKTGYSKSMIYSMAAAIVLTIGLGFLLYPQTISVPNGYQESIYLADGSTVELAGGSSISYNRLFGKTNRDIKLNGKAFFSVEKDIHPFIITGAHTRTTVVGTEFSLEDWDDSFFSEASIDVVEGNVLFNSLQAAKEVSLKAGESSRLDAKFEPTKSAFKSDALSWRDGHHFFDNMNIHEVLRTLERDFGKVIDHPAEHDLEGRITAFYRSDRSLESIIADICTIKGYTYYNTKDGYRIIPG